MLTLKTIEAHAEGAPVRLIVDGFPTPRGRTMIDKQEWARRTTDRLRRALMLDPRGHADMCGAILTEPVSPGSHAGVLFMDNDGYCDLLGHGVIAATTIALERGLVMPGGDGATIVFDTAAGTIHARAALGAGPDVRVDRVSMTNVPSFVLLGGLAVKLGGRQIRADIAFGGAFHAVVDAESVGVPADVSHVPELRRAGMDIKRAIDAAHEIVHPTDPRLRGIHGTVFTGPPHSGDADLRTVAVFADGAVDRSPSGTGASAIMAVLDALGLLDPERPFVCEGILGTRVAVRLSARTVVGEQAALVPEVTGSAWIIGEETWNVDEADPFAEGYRV